MLLAVYINMLMKCPKRGRILVAVIFISGNLIFGNFAVFAKEITIATVDVSNRGYIDDAGLNQGSSYEIVNSIVEAAGLTHQNSLMPFGRVLQYLTTGDVDIALLIPNEKVTQVAIPLVYIQDVNFILVGKPDFQIASLDDVEGKTIGYLRRTPTFDQLMGHRNINMVAGGKYSHLIEMLMRDRIDALFAPESNLYWALNDLGYLPSQIGEPLSVHKLALHLVYSKKSADDKTMAAIMDSAEALKKNHAIQAIINKYDYSITK